MTPTIKAVPHNWTMDRLARFLTDNEITGSPVTDDNGDIIGIATLKDITEFRWNASRSGVSPADREDRKRPGVCVWSSSKRWARFGEVGTS